MTENMKNFLDTVSQNEELTAKVGTLNKEGLIALAKELGMALTEADFENLLAELTDDELDDVSGGSGGTGKNFQRLLKPIIL